MNYQRQYDLLIRKAKNRSKIDGYSEKHHIVPLCLKGSDNKENIVKLTAREHFVAHWLLYRIYPNSNSLKHAFWMMCNGYTSSNQSRYTPSSRAFQEAKEAHSKILKLKESNFKGKHHSTKSKLKISAKLKGRKLSTETCKKMSSSKIGYSFSEETKQKISNSHLGRKKSELHCQNISLSHTKKVIDIATGQIYMSASEAASFYNYSVQHLSKMLGPNEKYKNKTTLTYVN